MNPTMKDALRAAQSRAHDADRDLRVEVRFRSGGTMTGTVGLIGTDNVRIGPWLVDMRDIAAFRFVPEGATRAPENAPTEPTGRDTP